MDIDGHGPGRTVARWRRGITAIGLLMGIPAVAVGLASPASAVSGSVAVVSSSAWGPDSSGLDHVVGEIVDSGSTDVNVAILDVNLLDSGGNVLDTVPTAMLLDRIAPGGRSPFDAPFSPPAGYSSYSIGVAQVSASTLAPDHAFATALSGTTTSNGVTYLTGTITNDNTTTVRNVQAFITLLGPDGTVVGETAGSANTNGTSDLAPGQQATFDAPLDTNQPAYASTEVVGESFTTPSSAGPLPVTRLWGLDAVETTALTGLEAFPNGANAVVLARSDFFSDALAGGPLAASVGGPLLITPGGAATSLDPITALALVFLLPPGGTVYLLGGTQALSPDIASEIQQLGFTPQRIAGDTEAGTAVAVAQQLGNPSTVFESTGLSFQDALSSVPAAIATHGAILLTDGSTQDPETAAYLSAHQPATRYAIGGPQAAAGADPSATPVYGADLWGTSAAVAARFFPSPTTVGFATGLSFPDALGGGVFLGLPGTVGPMLLVDSSAPLPQPITDYLSSAASTLTQGYLFGGPAAVGDDVVQAVEAVG